LVKKSLRFAKDNPIAITFLFKFMTAAAFGIGWYHKTNFRLDQLEKEVIELRAVEKKPVSVQLGDPQCRDKLATCGKSLNQFAHYHIKQRVNM
jgi:hypothetical protein